jgi:hypothetical protein
MSRRQLGEFIKTKAVYKQYKHPFLQPHQASSAYQAVASLRFDALLFVTMPCMVSRNRTLLTPIKHTTHFEAQRASIKSASLDMWPAFISATLAGVPAAAFKTAFDRHQVPRHHVLIHIVAGFSSRPFATYATVGRGKRGVVLCRDGTTRAACATRQVASARDVVLAIVLCKLKRKSPPAVLITAPALAYFSSRCRQNLHSKTRTEYFSILLFLIGITSIPGFDR